MAKRVLHVLGSLERGGVETWLMHVLRRMDKERLSFDFLVHTDRKCAYDDEARSLGARIIYNPDPRNPARYAFNFFKNLREYGPYDVVHSHVHHYSGYVLFLARLFNVPVRIAHSHNDTRHENVNNDIFRAAYLKIMENAIRKNATIGLAASRKAAESLFGVRWDDDIRWRIHYYSIDLTPFKEEVDERVVRDELGIPQRTFVVGHVGRFQRQKNHSFILEIAAEVTRRDANTLFLMVGEGPLRMSIQERAKVLGISDRLIFTGTRPDVPRLMLGAMDLFLFPSLFEGLGIVLLEAQSAGLSCVISDVIPEEVDVVKELILRLSLEQPPEEWAEAILRIKNSQKADRERCLRAIEESRFNIEHSIAEIEEIYLGRESC